MRAVLVYPLAHPCGEEILNAAGIETAVLGDDRAETITVALASAHGVILRGPAKITLDMIERAPDLRVIGALGAGTDNIDLRAATQHGVVVVSGAGVAPTAVAEFSIGAAIAAHRDFLGMHEAMMAGTVDWNTRLSVLAGNELTGSTLGVIGLGNIGREVARLAIALFGAHVLAYDPLVEASDVPPGVELSGLDDMLRSSTTVCVHTALTEQSRGLLGMRELELIGPQGVLVNAARGGIVDEDALFEALSSRKLKGAVLDVFASEPPSQEWIDRLGSVRGLMLTPHMAGVTLQSQEGLCRSVATEVLAVLQGRSSQRLVIP
ncbi:MAG: NAD(P)-dependent oxidoreductase [Acidimicrobiales bacterium]